MATRSSILAWKTPWTVEPGGLYSSCVHKESDTAEARLHCVVNNPPSLSGLKEQRLIMSITFGWNPKSRWISSPQDGWSSRHLERGQSALTTRGQN